MTTTIRTLAGALLVSACAAAATERLQAQMPGELTITRHSVELDEGPYEFERGVLLVPQNRETAESGVFELVFHRFPALPGADPDTPPIFLLNGGPGWPGLGTEVNNAAFLENNILPRARLADLVLVGQRGIGSSAPNTTCEGAPRPAADDPYDAEAQREALVAAARRCREKWESEGVDLTGITVVEAARDVRDVAEALGYDRVQIHGGSFGSHWGMTVLRYHPDLVERAVLNGMEGPDHTYDMPGWVLGALERAAADAEASGRFDGRWPPGGILGALQDVIERAESEPIAVDVVRRGGRDTIAVTLTADDVRRLAGGWTPSRDGHRLAHWPADLIALHEGRLEGAANAVLRNRFGGSSLPTAAFFMLDCGSGITGVRLERLLSDPGAEVVGNLGGWYELLCPVWQSDLGDDFRAAFETDVPTVIVHGNWDTSTPLENALELRPYFTNHRFVLVERGTHGALGEARRASPEFREALERFIATGDMSALPDTVTLPEVEWVAPPE